MVMQQIRTELPWSLIQQEIEHAVKEGFSNLRFVKTRDIANYIQNHNGQYPSFSKYTPKNIRCRITIALNKDELGTGWRMWNAEKTHTRGSPVWVVPWCSD